MKIKNLIFIGIFILLFSLPNFADSDWYSINSTNTELMKRFDGTDKDNTIKGTESDDLIYAGKGNDTISSYSGNDTIYAEEGDDTIFAGPGNDIIYGGCDRCTKESGNDNIMAGSGNDIINGEDGDDIILACDGDDIIIDTDDSTSLERLEGGNGNDTFYLGKTSAIVKGGEGTDTVYLIKDFYKKKTKIDSEGYTIYYNSKTKKTVKIKDVENIIFVSQEDLDKKIKEVYNPPAKTEDKQENQKLSFSSFYSPELRQSRINYLQSFSLTDFDFGLTLMANKINVDVKTGLGTGTSENDVIYGDKKNNTIKGLAGNDIILGKEGDDHLFDSDNKGEGVDNDYIEGGEGNDTIESRTGEDIIISGEGNDTIKINWGGSKTEKYTTYYGAFINSGSGDDTIIGGSQQVDEIIFAGSGKDYIIAGYGDDYIDGGSDNDYIYGDYSPDRGDYTFEKWEEIHNHGQADDTILGGDGDDSIYGQTGNDTIYGEEGNDLLDGGYGNDKIDGGNGKNIIKSGAGNDTIYSNTSDSDTIYTDIGDDTVYSSSNKTTIDTGIGNDEVFNKGKNAKIKTKEGNDYIYTEGENAEIYGEEGNDTIVLGDFAKTAINGGDGIDTVYLPGNKNDWTISKIEGEENTYLYSHKNGTEVILINIETVIFGAKKIEFTTSLDKPNFDIQEEYNRRRNAIIDGDKEKGMEPNEKGKKLIPTYKKYAREYIENTNKTDKSTDKVVSEDIDNDGIVDVLGYDPNDILMIDKKIGPNDSRNYIGRNREDDKLEGDIRDNTLKGLGGNDKLIGHEGDDVLDGGTGNDEIAGGSGNDIIYGGDGQDAIYSGSGSNIIFAGDGDDVIKDFYHGIFDMHEWKRDGYISDSSYIDTGEGNDTVATRGGSDLIILGNGDDDCVIGGPSGEEKEVNHIYPKGAYVDGGTGDDRLYGAEAREPLVILGGLGNDQIIGGLHDDYIDGGEGDEIIYGDFRTIPQRDYRDSIPYQYRYYDYDGKNEAEEVCKLPTTDYYKESIKDKQNDKINGGNGNDRIYGQMGDDIIYGGNGDDTIYGGIGDDLIDGGNGTDAIQAGSGDDTIYSTQGKASIDAGKGNDTIYSTTEGKIHGKEGNDYIYTEGENTEIYGEEGNDTIVLGDFAKTAINGGDGIDTVYLPGNKNDWTISKIEGEENAYLYTHSKTKTEVILINIETVIFDAQKANIDSDYVKNQTNIDLEKEYNKRREVIIEGGTSLDGKITGGNKKGKTLIPNYKEYIEEKEEQESIYAKNKEKENKVVITESTPNDLLDRIENCWNGIDDDLDGLIDKEDPDCENTIDWINDIPTQDTQTDTDNDGMSAQTDTDNDATDTTTEKDNSKTTPYYEGDCKVTDDTEHWKRTVCPDGTIIIKWYYTNTKGERVYDKVTYEPDGTRVTEYANGDKTIEITKDNYYKEEKIYADGRRKVKEEVITTNENGEEVKTTTITEYDSKGNVTSKRVVVDRKPKNEYRNGKKILSITTYPNGSQIIVYEDWTTEYIEPTNESSTEVSDTQDYACNIPNISQTNLINQTQFLDKKKLTSNLLTKSNLLSYTTISLEDIETEPYDATLPYKIPNSGFFLIPLLETEESITLPENTQEQTHQSLTQIPQIYIPPVSSQTKESIFPEPFDATLPYIIEYPESIIEIPAEDFILQNNTQTFDLTESYPTKENTLLYVIDYKPVIDISDIPITEIQDSTTETETQESNFPEAESYDATLPYKIEPQESVIEIPVEEIIIEENIQEEIQITEDIVEKETQTETQESNFPEAEPYDATLPYKIEPQEPVIEIPPEEIIVEVTPEQQKSEQIQEAQPSLVVK